MSQTLASGQQSAINDWSRRNVKAKAERIEAMLASHNSSSSTNSSISERLTTSDTHFRSQELAQPTTAMAQCRAVGAPKGDKSPIAARAESAANSDPKRQIGPRPENPKKSRIPIPRNPNSTRTAPQAEGSKVMNRQKYTSGSGEGSKCNAAPQKHFKLPTNPSSVPRGKPHGESVTLKGKGRVPPATVIYLAVRCGSHPPSESDLRWSLYSYTPEVKEGWMYQTHGTGKESRPHHQHTRGILEPGLPYSFIKIGEVPQDDEPLLDRIVRSFDKEIFGNINSRQWVLYILERLIQKEIIRHTDLSTLEEKFRLLSARHMTLMARNAQ
ncbi:hypothetical protein FQN54_009843 [Arachnomyces sp. PD_36]|nr:hypothetical protein FQN54_009843 [Arachnomyces sp. PD_36]